MLHSVRGIPCAPDFRLTQVMKSVIPCFVARGLMFSLCHPRLEEIPLISCWFARHARTFLSERCAGQTPRALCGVLAWGMHQLATSKRLPSTEMINRRIIDVFQSTLACIRTARDRCFDGRRAEHLVEEFAPNSARPSLFRASTLPFAAKQGRRDGIFT